jgi:NAD(P)H-quinone oxidoreductase subunit 5
MSQPALLAPVFLLLVLLTAGAAVMARLRGVSLPRVWQLAMVAASAGLVIALGLFGLALSAVWGNAQALAPAPMWGLQVDLLATSMVVLVAFLGLVILNYSRTYLQGEANQPAYVSAFLLTLAAVFVVAAADHLLVLIAAWSVTSFSLHRLLMFYSGRPGAVLAAHKKFLASRLAEIMMLGGALLMYSEAGSFSISALAHSDALAKAPGQWGLALMAIGVILKSALLPAHGWLIQVMEAPTPVSALLHAGVVNLGGFALIRMAGLFEQADVAQGMLVVTGSLTALAAALVMMTRISIKVRLAWSTCAQMGFMIMTCGLGLYDLAFLHLVGHSLYKAHAFLSAGSRVHEARLTALQPAVLTHQAPHRLMQLCAPLLSVVVLTVLFAWASNTLGAAIIAPGWILILSLAWAPLLWLGSSHRIAGLAKGLALVLGLGLAYLLMHWMITPLGLSSQPLHSGWMVWAVMCSALLYMAQVVLHGFRHSPLAERCYPWVYGGFYLDEIFTRWTFWVWPVQMPRLTAGSSQKTAPALPGLMRSV